MGMIINPSRFGSGVTLPWTPTYLTKVAWWRADSGITISTGSNVSTWDPKEGSGQLSVFGTAPTFASSVINSQPALTIGGAGRMQFGYTNTTNKVTLAWVGTLENAGAAYGRTMSLNNTGAGADWNNTSGFNVGRNNTTNEISLAYNSGGSPTQAVGYTTFYIAVVVFDGTLGSLYINGTLLGTVSATAAFNINRFAWGGAATGTNYGSSKLADMVLKNEDASTGERQKLEGYFAHRYAMTSVLPSGHPYKTTAPTT